MGSRLPTDRSVSEGLPPMPSLKVPCELPIPGLLLNWQLEKMAFFRIAPVPTTLEPALLPPALIGLEEQLDSLRELGGILWQRGWSVGTSSNYSVVVNREPLEIVVTASGKDKGRLKRTDFVRVGSDGKPVVEGQPKSSAETLLHVVAAQQPGVGAVLHTHSVWSTVLSDHFFSEGGFELAGYEMLKGLEGIRTHETTAWVEIFDNTQDIPSLAAQVKERMNDAANPLQYGYLIRRHGLYTWGRDLEEARRHVEIFEFLFECVARRMLLASELKTSLA
jgi:methylthioribulose-1-phosphate dehydratase